MGHMKALFMMNAFETALHDITNVTTIQDVKDFLQELQQEEDTDHLQIINNDGPTTYFKRYFEKANNTNEEQIMELATMFAKSPNFCHTARLPAEIRHKGILTETNETGFTTYYKGIGKKEADQNPNDSEFMRLVFDDDERYECPVYEYLDFKDFFYVNDKDASSKKLIIPNDAEIQEYSGIVSNYKELKGIFAVCLKSCDWGNCPNGDMRGKDLADKKVEITINNQKVSSNLIYMTAECEILKTESGGINFPITPNGKFQISVKVNEPNSFIRVSSFIVF